MRLLSFTLPLLLLVSPSLGAPASSIDDGPRTTIETICETIIHEITEPTTEAPKLCACPTPAADIPVPVPRTTIETIWETVTRTVIHEVTQPATTEATTTVAPCACAVPVTTPRPCSCAPAVTEAPTPKPCVCAVPVTTPRPCSCAPAVTEAPTPKPCSCTDGVDSGANYPVPASDAIATGVSIESTVDEAIEETRTCDCDESKACRKESLSTMDACMEECNEHLEVYGDKTEAYRGCFSKNNASIVEAEDCLFKDTKCKETKNVEDPTDWDSLSDIAYESKANETIANNYLWKRDEAKYNNIQTFFHCTKHCMHKKVQECTSEKKCTIQMPERDEFAAKMRQCTKENNKISQSIFAACQCLAWNNEVKELRGSCVVIGNTFFIDRA